MAVIVEVIDAVRLVAALRQAGDVEQQRGDQQEADAARRDQADGPRWKGGEHVQGVWLAVGVLSGFGHAIADFLKRIGRRKLILPTYDALAASSEGREFARKIFAEAKPGYHPITTAAVEAALSKPTSKR